MAEVHHIHEGDTAGSSMALLAVILIVIALAAVLAVLAYNGAFFRATTPADQGKDIEIRGDVTIPSSTSSPAY